MTKTLRPVVAEPPEPGELLDDGEEDPLEEQAATATADATTSVEAANGARLSKARIVMCPFVAWIGLVPVAAAGSRAWRPGGRSGRTWRRSARRRRPAAGCRSPPRSPPG